MKTKKQLIEEIKDSFRLIHKLENKNHKKIIEMLPKFTARELKDIIEDNEIEIWHLEQDIEG